MAHDPALILQRQRRALARANKLLQEQKIRLYQQTLQGQLPTFLPDYPLRFLVMIRRPKTQVINQMLDQGHAQMQAPLLEINAEGQIMWEQEILGSVNKDERETIATIGEHMLDLYQLDIIEIRWSDDMSKVLYLALEMVRPELYINSQGVLTSPDDPQSGGTHEPAEAPPLIIARAIEDEVKRQSGGGEGRIARGSA